MMRVFIADDEEIIRDGIRNCIEKEQERFLFAGEAPDLSLIHISEPTRP